MELTELKGLVRKKRNRMRRLQQFWGLQKPMLPQK